MRTPPEMPLGLPFIVDTWGPSRRHRRHRFITHAHTDHIAGAWACPGDTVYATQLTMRLALQRYPQLERGKFVEMEVGKRWVVDDPAGAFSVTAYDANHCPGAVMLLLEGPFGTILHTGDCRLTSDCVRKLLLKLEANLCRLDTVYLDLTFPKFLEFPSKESAIQQIIACIAKHSHAPFVYLACERLGQEEILKEVSRSFGSKIYVDKGLYLDCFNTLSHTVPEIITDDPTRRFQVLPVNYEELNKIATEKLEEARARDQLEPLFIRPSAFWYSIAYGQNQKPSLTEAEQVGHGVWRVCFSNHSSGNELEQALQLLQPQWVISTTPPNFASELSYVRRRYLSHTTNGHAPSSICFRTTSSGKEDYEYFVRGIPSRGQRSPTVVQIEKKWVDHRTFGLSMGVNGYISEHAINIMGKAIMSEQRDAHFFKHVLPSELGKIFQGPSTCRENISNYLSEPNQGFKLKNLDAVFVPLQNCKTWYLVVANFWKRRFEVLSPMGCTNELITQAQSIVWNFRKAFHSLYPQFHTVTIEDMDITFHTISNSDNESDSGIFIMKALDLYDGEKHIFFNDSDAKGLREHLTLYLLHHKNNEIPHRHVQGLVAP